MKRRSQKGKGPEVYDLEHQDHLHDAQQEEHIMWRWQISQEVRMLTELCHQQKLENTLLQQELRERRAQKDQRAQQEKEQKELATHLPPLALQKNRYPSRSRRSRSPGNEEEQRGAMAPRPSMAAQDLRKKAGPKALQFRRVLWKGRGPERDLQPRLFLGELDHRRRYNRWKSCPSWFKA